MSKAPDYSNYDGPWPDEDEAVDNEGYSTPPPIADRDEVESGDKPAKKATAKTTAKKSASSGS